MRSERSSHSGNPDPHPRAGLRARIGAFAERRLPALTRYRKPEPLPIRLHRRRIYILPTRFGLYAGVLLAVMLLGALNFNNNAALLLTFSLAGILFLSPLRAVQSLQGVSLERVECRPVHAGDSAELACSFAAESQRERAGIELAGPLGTANVDLSAGGECALGFSTEHRGWQPLPCITAASDAPFGFFRAWSVLRPRQSALIWPRPEADSCPLPDTGMETDGRTRHAEGDDWDSLRDYRPGDPPRRVAWKPSARVDRLLVREPALPADGPLRLRWSDTATLPFEARVSRLTRWVLDAAKTGRRFALELPQQSLGPDHGAAFRDRCLTALALL